MTLSTPQSAGPLAPPPQPATSGGDATTRSGFRFHIRPASPDDEPALAEFFTHVSRDDLRFRFLSAVREVGHERLAAMTAVDHDRTEDFLAIDPDGGAIIATAMLAADPKRERAEVAIAIREDFKRRGVSWTLLEHVTRYAGQQGFKVLESIESRDNRAAIELEREMGFSVESVPGDATLVIVRRALD